MCQVETNFFRVTTLKRIWSFVKDGEALSDFTTDSMRYGTLLHKCLLEDGKEILPMRYIFDVFFKERENCETTLYKELSGVPVRGTIDYTYGGDLYDLKTTSAALTFRGVESSFYTFGYDIQLACYRKLLGTPKASCFIVWCKNYKTLEGFYAALPIQTPFFMTQIKESVLQEAEQKLAKVLSWVKEFNITPSDFDDLNLASKKLMEVRRKEFYQ